MKKALLILGLLLIFSTGCSKNTETSQSQNTKVYCSDCAAESKEVSKYCKECGIEAKWVSEKPEISKENDKKEIKDSNKDNNKKEVKSKVNDYDRGYKDGYKAGYQHAIVSETGGDHVRTYTDYDNGYVDGFNQGMIDCINNGEDYESIHGSSYDDGLGDRAPAAFDGSCGFCGSYNVKILSEDEVECLDCGAYKDFYSWWPGDDI